MTERFRLKDRVAWLPPTIAVVFVLLLCGAVALFFLARWQRQTLGSIRAANGNEALLAEVQVLLADAETGQRGYLLTGRSVYLEPYQVARRALDPALEQLRQGLVDDPDAVQTLDKLKSLAAAKFAELQQTIALRDSDSLDSVLAVVNSDAGKQWMDASRATIAELHTRFRRSLTRLRDESDGLTQTRENLLMLIAIALLIFGAIVLSESRRQFRELEAAREKLREEEQTRMVAESQVRQLQKMEAIGQLTGGIAHDFNNMLSVIMASLEVAKLKLAPENAETERLIHAALSATERASALTARLLAFARRQPLSPVVLDPNKLISGMAELLRRALGENISTEFVLAGGIWKLFVDPVQLETSILNLAVNARDAMPDGGKITIETNNASLDESYAGQHQEVKAGQYVLLSVTDTGCGMSSDTADRAFEPFFTTKPVGHGTGLGLSQVFGFVKQSGGHVKIYSEKNSGTSVKIYLPRHTGNAAASTWSNAAIDAMPVGSAEAVILLVEDEESLRDVASEALKNLGYTVIATGSPSEALAVVHARDDVALLFTDVVMPGMNGRQLAEEVAKVRKDLPVLYTTGYTRNAIVHNGVVDAGVEFLQKPFSIAQLARKVKDILDRKS